MFALLSVMFGRSVGSSSGEAARRLRCSPVDERSSDSENRKAYRTNSGSVADHPPLVIAGLDPAIQEIPGSCYVCPGIT